MKKYLPKILVCLTLIFMLSSMLSIGASAKTVKSEKMTYTFRDSLITSIVVGRIRSTYTWTYENNKLIDEKSINHTIVNCKIGCSFKDVKKYWAWYNTGKNGDGRGYTEFTFGIGLSTQWFNLGNFKDYWYGMTVRPNGSWTMHY